MTLPAKESIELLKSNEEVIEVSCGNCRGTGTIPVDDGQGGCDMDVCHICNGEGLFLERESEYEQRQGIDRQTNSVNF